MITLIVHYVDGGLSIDPCISVVEDVSINEFVVNYGEGRESSTDLDTINYYEYILPCGTRGKRCVAERAFRARSYINGATIC